MMECLADINIDSHFNSVNYTLIESIGEGGFGQVFKARQNSTGQVVAIKFLTITAGLAPEKKQRYIDRFERECQLGSLLQHPNIVRLLDRGRNGDLFYAVFEYVEGRTLKHILLEDGALSPLIAAELMAQVLDGLVHAHQQGVIHRDIKPANIMLGRVGARQHVKILDFGIGAMSMDARQIDYNTLTLTSETIGTPAYSAPEQLRGEPPTGKSDIYAWGLVLLECLTGKPAVNGSSLAAIFHKQLSTSNVPLPSTLIGHPLANLIRRVLNKKTNERVADAAEVYREFKALNFANLVGKLVDDSESVETQGNDHTQVTYQQYGASALVERKQLTVLCLSLEASAEEHYDKDIIDTLLQDQLSQCSDIAIRFGAYMVGSMADTLLFYFGYPKVSDNDSRLCARAALDMCGKIKRRNAFSSLSQGVEINLRIGIHSGMVSTHGDSVPRGETPNIAMKLMGWCKVNEIYCSEESKNLLGRYHEFHELSSEQIGAVQYKGPLYLLTGERKLEAFGFLNSQHVFSALVGRELELESLKALLTSGDKRKRLAYIYGEAGIGKSRLLFALREEAKNLNQTVLQCLPENRNNALYPILNVIKHKYSLDILEPRKVVERLRLLLRAYKEGQVFTSLKPAASSMEDDSLKLIEKQVAILCSWLNLELPDDTLLDSELASSFSPDIQKNCLFPALNTLLLVADNGSFKPSLFLFEDLHWLDPTSAEFIKYFINTTEFESGNHGLVCTSRGAPQKQLAACDFHCIELSPLKKSATTQFVERQFELPPCKKLMEAIVQRSDGIPLFMEELINMIKQGGLKKNQQGELDFANTQQEQVLPVNLQDSLQYKLDVLVAAKETAQLAASIGREFDYDILVASSIRSELQLQADLNELLEAQLIYLQRKTQCDAYIFKHALVRDAAYNSMLAGLKIKMHSVIAESIETQFPERAKANPILLSQHYSAAEDFQKASKYGTSAVQQQVKTFAHQEALMLAEQVIAWSKKIGSEVQSLEAELAVNEAVLPAELSLKGYGDKTIASLSERIRQINEKLQSLTSAEENARPVDQYEKQETEFKANWAEFLNFHYTSKRKEARVLGRRMLSEVKAEKQRLSNLQEENSEGLDAEFLGKVERVRQKEMVVLSQLAQAHMVDGEMPRALEEFELAISLYDDVLDVGVAAEFGVDPKALSLAISSYGYLHSGSLQKAHERIEKAIVFAEYQKNDISVVFAYMFNALLLYFTRGNGEEILQLVETYRRRHDVDVWHRVFLDLLYACSQGGVDGAKEAERLLEEINNSGQDFAVGWYVPAIAQAHLKNGHAGKAVSLLEACLEKQLEQQILPVLPFLRHSLARSYYQQYQHITKKIETLLSTAINECQQQNALYFEYEIRAYHCSLLAGSVAAGSRERLAVLHEQLCTDVQLRKSTAFFLAQGVLKPENIH